MGGFDASREVTQEDLAERAVYLGTLMFTSLKTNMDTQNDGLENVPAKVAGEGCCELWILMSVRRWFGKGDFFQIWLF